MEKKNFRYLVLFLILSHVTLQGLAQKIRIACVGSGTTAGIGVANPEKNSYPAQLQSLLGEPYGVMNFGVTGATLLNHGSFPYRETPAYRKALASKPDLVFIQLGSNDSKEINRPFYPEFEKDYRELITSFRELGSHPRIVLLLPAPSFSRDSTFIYDPVILKEITPRIQQVAYEMGCEVINLYPLFTDNPDMMADLIHPNSLGATIIARRLYEVVKLEEVPKFDGFSRVTARKKVTSFYGYECADFDYYGHASKIVRPKKALKGLPWIWRARFWGHEPQTDIALLERGFHLVYCDVAELYGNPEAVKIWNGFYGYMLTAGLSKKTVLEGMSRGGVYIYNWALANPGQVACIYADAPVLDLKSWPGGKGKGPGSPDDWELVKKDYGLTAEQGERFSDSPLNHAEKIAKLGFPMLHVVGDADEVVPVDENTNPFEQKVKSAGGIIQVIHKPGVKHHPHSLTNPTPIVDFILRATGVKTNFAIIPAPGSEYRPAAGWEEGTDWWTQNDDINKMLLARKQTDIIFLGNSITQGIGGERPSVTYKPGKASFDSLFHRYTWISAGISGDRTQHVLWRLMNGPYAATKPKILVLTIGVNNFADDSGEETAEGIRSIVNWLKLNLPDTHVILIGPLPCGLRKDDPRRVKFEKTHAIIENFANWNQIHYFNLSKTFIRDNGELNTDLCSTDGIHLMEKGYRAWAGLLAPLIQKYTE